MHKVGNVIPFGGYDWRVLCIDGDKTLVLSDKLIIDEMYDFCCDTSTWEDCYLRKYLNSEFYDSFSDSDKSKIIEVSIENKDNQWFGTPGGNTTKDRVFLLSIEEVILYFGDSGDLKNRRGRYYSKGEYKIGEPDRYISDQYDSARKAYDMSNIAQYWWLRSPGMPGEFSAKRHDVATAAIVNDDVAIAMDGNAVDDTLCTFVRPALWLSSETT